MYIEGNEIKYVGKKLPLRITHHIFTILNFYLRVAQLHLTTFIPKTQPKEFVDYEIKAAKKQE